MSHNDLILTGPDAERVTNFFEHRPEVTECDPTCLRESMAFLNRSVLDATNNDSPNGDLTHVAQTVATVARCDMSSAFSLWCQRMVSEYLSVASPGSMLRTSVLPKVLHADLLGSTALASAMAHYVSGSPIPITAQRSGSGYVLNGRVFWASNLFPPDFLMVTAVTDGEGGRPLIVAIPGDAPGLNIDPYPHLMALQGTGSSSLEVDGVQLDSEWVVSDEFEPFIQRVRPTFLLLQCSFAYGLAQRSLDEARASLRGVKDVMKPDLDALDTQSVSLVGQLRDALADRGTSISTRDLVKLRLDCAHLATASVALEAKAVGGRAYVVSSPTARRMREAAFLPIQAPTEGQLRWELSRYE